MTSFLHTGSIEKSVGMWYFDRDLVNAGREDRVEKKKLLIAAANEELRLALRDMLRGAFQVYCCADGYEARRTLETLRPDVMVVDVMLAGVDGISLLQWAAGQGIRSRIMLISRLPSDYVVDAATRLGVGYIMLTPCDLGALAARVEDLGRSLVPEKVAQTDPRGEVAGILLALGLRPKLKGYACLREAILLCAEDEHMSVTKVLYPEVAKRCGCKAGHVERNIRSAIESAWEVRDERVWRLYFPPDSSGCVARPTNAWFIARLADSLRTRKAG